jgi:hypothetical protein
MNKLLMTTALLALFAFPAMADELGPNGGGNNNVVTSSDVDLGSGYYSSVEELTERLERLKAQQAAGKLFYGNSKWPIANAIAKTQRALNKAQWGTAKSTTTTGGSLYD